MLEIYNDGIEPLEHILANYPVTIVQFNYLPTLRAKLAVSRSNPQQALDILAAADLYELGLPAYSFYNWPNFTPSMCGEKPILPRIEAAKQPPNSGKSSVIGALC